MDEDPDWGTGLGGGGGAAAAAAAALEDLDSLCFEEFES